MSMPCTICTLKGSSTDLRVATEALESQEVQAWPSLGLLLYNDYSLIYVGLKIGQGEMSASRNRNESVSRHVEQVKAA